MQSCAGYFRSEIQCFAGWPGGNKVLNKLTFGEEAGSTPTLFFDSCSERPKVCEAGIKW
jgi:hypothetical protein